MTLGVLVEKKNRSLYRFCKDIPIPTLCRMRLLPSNAANQGVKFAGAVNLVYFGGSSILLVWTVNQTIKQSINFISGSHDKYKGYLIAT